MTWNCFLYCWPYVRGCWTNSWYASGLRCHDSHMKYIQWQESYCGDRLLIRSSHLDNKNSYTGNRASLSWNNSRNRISIEGTHLLAKKISLKILKFHTMHDKTAKLYFLSFCSSVNQNQCFDELCKCWVTCSQKAVIAGCRVKPPHGCHFMVSLPLSWCPLCYPHYKYSRNPIDESFFLEVKGFL